MAGLVENAFAYAGIGFEVFPVDPAQKRPLVSQLHATVDLDQVEEWWATWPDALIGHRIAEEHLLLDVDPRHGGKETWAALRKEMPEFTTRTHVSGREDGGGHIWFKRPGGKLTVVRLDTWAKERELGEQQDNGRWTAGIDLLRREHRYTILPPSPHPATGKPYRWARGKGLNIEPAAMPDLLAGLLEKHEDDPKPRQPAAGLRQVGSIADWFSDTANWRDILQPHGWTLIEGDGDEDGSRWRHPTATNEWSATVKYGCLFVYSPNTPFETSGGDDVHGYTRFRAYSVLDHSGDMERAARAARQAKGPDQKLTVAPSGSPGASETGSQVQRVGLEHLEAFWGLRPVLGSVRDFARSRRCSPWAMLGVVLARVAAAVPPFVVLPPLIGSHLSLNLYVCLVGGSGAGKDAAISAGRDALDLSAGLDFNAVGLGSGEGILDQYVVYKPPDKQTQEPARIEQHTTSVLFTNPEIETVSALKGRSNATLMPMLRDAWMGSTLGFAYADRERRLRVGEHQYRLCLILGAQPTSAHVLLGEQAVGTPQRFLWLPVHDPQAPEMPPDAPEMPSWRLPVWPTAEHGKVALGLCGEAVEAIDNARLARLRGDDGEVEDGHSLACREKVSALFAILDGRTTVNLEDWSLAGIVQTVSTRTREDVQSALDLEQRRVNQAKGKAEAERHVIVSETVDDHTVARVARRISMKLSGEWITHSELRRKIAQRDREHFEEAMDRLIQAGQVKVEEYTSAKNASSKRYRL